MSYLTNYKDKIEVVQIIEKDFAKQLSNALSYPNIIPDHSIVESMHFRYFVNYLVKDPNGLRAKTFIEEKDYLSLSYMGDYINYYAHCFKPYNKFCKRVHFFRESFDSPFLEKMLESDEKKYSKFWNSYLGHIVIKPLPKGVIGATIIKPYDVPNKNRFYTAVRPYKVNIFGKQLIIDSLPYQEQDGIVGSCASSALWFAFHKTQELFKTSVPNPSDITLSAGTDSFHSGIEFPNNSLELTQICKAITSTGLVSELNLVLSYLQNDKWLKAFVYAYCRMGIPILMGIDIDKEGEHLVTLTGYRFSKSDKKKSNDTEKSRISPIDILNLRSDRIIKFYAHDDQVGPFSRLEFIPDHEKEIKSDLDINNAKGALFQFKTSWWENVKDIKNNNTLLAYATSIIVPIKKTIKVKFQTILDQITTLNFSLIKELEKNHKYVDFIWDIYLTTNSHYKRDVINEMKHNFIQYDDNARGVLFRSIPEFIWIVKAKISTGNYSYLIFEILYDAIDMDILHNPFYTNFYNDSFKSLLHRYHMLDSLENINFPLLNFLLKDKSVLNLMDTELTEIMKSMPANENFEIKDLLSKIDRDHVIALKLNKIVNKQKQTGLAKLNRKPIRSVKK